MSIEQSDGSAYRSGMTDPWPWQELSPRQADEERRAHPDLVVLDVRTEAEHFSHRLEASVLLPLHELPDRLDELDSTKPHLVLCEHGVRSVAACQLLAQRGFGDLRNLRGGIANWIQHGLPVVGGELP